jgi:hypothetical protein
MNGLSARNGPPRPALDSGVRLSNVPHATLALCSAYPLRWPRTSLARLIGAVHGLLLSGKRAMIEP